MVDAGALSSGDDHNLTRPLLYTFDDAQGRNSLSRDFKASQLCLAYQSAIWRIKVPYIPRRVTLLRVPFLQFSLVVT